MSIRWLTIFFLLVVFFWVDSDQLTYMDNKQGDDSADYVNPFELNGKLESGANLKAETQRIPIRLSHQEKIHYQHNTAKDTFSKRKDYQRMIAALSKIAKVQLAEENSDTIGRDLTSGVYNSTQRKTTYLPNNNPAKDTGRSTFSDAPFKLSFHRIFNRTSSNKIKRQYFHCKAIQDVYISDIKEKVPSYACKFGSKTFVLSSKRFFQDRRNNLDVNINDDTLRRLNSPSINPSRNGQFYVIPTLLVLEPGHENYDIRNQQNITLY